MSLNLTTITPQDLTWLPQELSWTWSKDTTGHRIHHSKDTHPITGSPLVVLDKLSGEGSRVTWQIIVCGDLVDATTSLRKAKDLAQQGLADLIDQLIIAKQAAPEVIVEATPEPTPAPEVVPEAVEEAFDVILATFHRGTRLIPEVDHFGGHRVADWYADHKKRFFDLSRWQCVDALEVDGGTAEVRHQAEVIRLELIESLRLFLARPPSGDTPEVIAAPPLSPAVPELASTETIDTLLDETSDLIDETTDLLDATDTLLSATTALIAAQSNHATARRDLDLANCEGAPDHRCGDAWEITVAELALALADSFLSAAQDDHDLALLNSPPPLPWLLTQSEVDALIPDEDEDEDAAAPLLPIAAHDLLSPIPCIWTRSLTTHDGVELSVIVDRYDGGVWQISDANTHEDLAQLDGGSWGGLTMWRHHLSQESIRELVGSLEREVEEAHPDRLLGYHETTLDGSQIEVHLDGACAYVWRLNMQEVRMSLLATYRLQGSLPHLHLLHDHTVNPERLLELVDEALMALT